MVLAEKEKKTYISLEISSISSSQMQVPFRMASNTFPSVMQLIKSTLLLGALSESEHAELADAPGTSSIIGVQSALLWQLHTSGNASLTGVMSLLLDDNHAGEDLGQIIAKV